MMVAALLDLQRLPSQHAEHPRLQADCEDVRKKASEYQPVADSIKGFFDSFFAGLPYSAKPVALIVAFLCDSTTISTNPRRSP